MMEEEENKRKINPLINLFKEEWKYLGKRKLHFIIYSFLFLMANAIALMSPLIIGIIFNTIQKTISSDAELKKLIFMISLLFFLEIGFWLFHGSARIFEQITSFHVHRTYTHDKVAKVLEFPVKWHKDHHSGDTIDKINRGREALWSFSMNTFDVFRVFLNILGSLIILFFIDAKIATFALIFSVGVITFSVGTDRYLSKYYRKLNKFSNKLSSSLFDYLSNIMTVITLRLRKVVLREVDERLMASYPTEKKTIIVEESKWATISIVISIMVVIALSYKAYTDYHTTGIILIGTLYMLYGYLDRVGHTFYQVAWMYSRLVKNSARVEGAHPIDNEFEKIKSDISGKIPQDWKEINIQNIDFNYNEDGKKNHLENVNVKFKKGQKIALVGESGSGKSTLLSLLRGLYPLSKGKVYCNGQELKKGLQKLKRRVTLIPQEPEIFNNTIGYNITMDLPAKKEEVNKFIKMAQFEKVVKRLEKGLDTNVLEKGVSLSGGEKQRLALARGLLAGKDSDIILLDEPTSSVDSLNESKIHDNIFKEFKNKTIISSIHRLHLLSKFDYIYLFDKGKIIAEGDFKTIQNNSKFKYLMRKYRLKKEK